MDWFKNCENMSDWADYLMSRHYYTRTVIPDITVMLFPDKSRKQLYDTRFTIPVQAAAKPSTSVDLPPVTFCLHKVNKL